MRKADLRVRASWLAGLAIACYFAYFAKGALRAHFALDDPMNMGFYWRPGLLRSMASVVMLWRPSYRPMGAAFYLPIYHLFGMNPLPYRIVVLAILAANIFLSYRIAMLLSQSRAAAALTAVLVAAHASMTPLYYNTSMIYDVLAFFFTAVMLWVYMRGGLTWMHGAAVAALYLAAINSKEIAVVGAAWVVAYEALVSKERRWTIPAILVAIGIAFTATRVFGSHSLSQEEGYRLQLTAHRFFVNARIYLNDLFYTSWFSTSRRVVIAWGLAAIVCAIARRRALWWAWFAASTAMLPLLFTMEPRAGGSLYLPLLAFALWASLAATVWFTPPEVKRGTERSVHPPVVSEGRRFAFRDRVVSPLSQWMAAALVALMVVPTTIEWWKDRAEWLLRDQRLTWSVLTQIRDLPSKPKPGSRVLIEQNPFQDWDTYFLANLVWNDHTLDIRLANKMNEPADPSRFDWVLTFDEDHLRVVKSGQ